ncbi:MAG: hypothetical protein H7Y30_11065 [Pyrinomonadaceae bacterium]|nr:hypothetical protein [Pyrinomonadaceae bacterium]
MFKRLFISILLITSLMLTATGRTLVMQDATSPPPAEEEQLTPEEELEARALAEEFIARFEKTQDVTPLLADMYVSDFVERLRDDDEIEQLIPFSVKREVAAQASSEEIRRLYAASINGIYLGMRLYLAADKKRKQERAQRGETVDPDSGEELTVAEILPPGLIQLMRSDPKLAAILEKELEREERERASPQNQTNTEPPDAIQPVENASDAKENLSSAATDSSQEADEIDSLEDMVPLKSLDDLRHYTKLMEQGVALIRERLKTLPPELNTSLGKYFDNEIAAATKDDQAQETKDMIYPRLSISSKEYLGYPAGTRIICAHPLIFHLQMVRGTDGHLKIFNVQMLSD